MYGAMVKTQSSWLKKTVVVALLVLSSASAVTAWTCSANIVASLSNPASFVERSVHCLPGGPHEITANLTVLLHPVLQGGSYSGRQWTPTSM